MPQKRLQSSLPPPKKKPRKSSNDDVKSLELAITAAAHDGSSLNPLADLLRLATSSSDAKTTHAAIYAIYRVVVTLAQYNWLNQHKDDAEEVKVVRSWLQARITEYSEFLEGLMKDDEKALRMAALDITLSLLIHLSGDLTSQHSPRGSVPLFRHLTRALLLCPPSKREGSDPEYGQGSGKIEPDVRDKFVDDNLSVHDDIRWFFLRESMLLLGSPERTEHTAHNLLSFLERLMTMPTESAELNTFWIPGFTKSSKKQDESDDAEPEDDDDWRKFFDEDDTSTQPKKKEKKVSFGSMSMMTAMHSLASHRAQFTKCWLALTPQLVSSSALSSRALSILHKAVLPHMTQPSRLMDWIAGCVDFGGTVGLLAFNGLFTLIKDYNLDYPDFYTRLYAYLDRDILHVKHRARFFRLLELFLSSTHLPAQLLASFVKRLSHLSLSAPPSAILIIIPFVFNILKRHPASMVLIHQEWTANYEDPFDPDERSPLLTNAIASSLWELASHQHHYLEGVSSMAKIFTTPFTQQPFAMEDFLDHTYTTLFESESKRITKIKKDPALMFEFKKDDLFPTTASATATEAQTLMPTDVVAELWRFG